MKEYQPEDCQDIHYFGCSDLLAQIADELSNRPQSCFSKNTQAWYTSVYTEVSEVTDCSYQVDINQDLCECEDVNGNPPNSIEDVVDVITSFVGNNPRRLQRALIRIICRQALRESTQNTAPNV